MFKFISYRDYFEIQENYFILLIRSFLGNGYKTGQIES